MRNKQSILFVRPDYHCSFFYREQFRKAGWKADIFVPSSYPVELLYSDKEILKVPQIKGLPANILKYINYFLLILWWFLNFWKYKYHLYYGQPPIASFFERKLGLRKIFGEDFIFELWLAKVLGVKLIYLPSGCHEEETKNEFTKLDSGNVCGNCGYWNQCDDEKNTLNFKRVRRYFDMQIGIGAIDSSQFKTTHFKYKSIDLEIWNPTLQVPDQYKLPKTKNIRILHSAYLEKSSRNWKGKNIKGSPFILDAIEKLKSEGFAVEYLFIKDKPSNIMRFYQMQADIVVEQLIYGWWGSTFVETSALGKPVVCYIRSSWVQFFFKIFPEYNELPIINANAENIYDVLKKLVTDDAYRKQKGVDSRLFAERHFDPEKNTQSLIKVLNSL